MVASGSDCSSEVGSEDEDATSNDKDAGKG